MPTALAILSAVAGLAAGAVLMASRAFRAEFERRSAAAVAAAGLQAGAPVTEDDLRGLPDALARWLRWSGAVGRPRISALHLEHGGRFRASATQGWMPIRGAYTVTTRRPAFVWYGRMTLAPGLHAAAIDAYEEGHGRMRVKVLSLLAVVDAGPPALDAAAFARCVAELVMTPTFFLDRDRATCEEVAPGQLRCRVVDGARAAAADLFVRPDGSLDRVEVQRPYDRGEGRTTLERFTGRLSGTATWDGRRLATRLEGTWHLPEGDLPYVDFEVEGARFE